MSPATPIREPTLRLCRWTYAALLLFCAAFPARGDSSFLVNTVPQNLDNFYHDLRERVASCQHNLAGGFYSVDNGTNTTSYCTNDPHRPSIIYLSGGNGTLSNMDIDCDGVQGGSQDDGRCSLGRSPDYQDATAFRDVIQSYNVGISDLNTYVHPYVVFGNSGSKPGWRTFDPTEYGVRPLSVMAVVCPGNKMVYGIWGDTNGDDGDKPMVGEVSIALATACWGKNMTGDNGYDGMDVLYVAFTGKDAVPGKNGADWAAKDYDTFERSIQGLGDKLVQRMRAGAGGRKVTSSWVVAGGVFAGGLWLAL
ncbi:fungal chitosanase of glycosyl hydrolase group 75-domain-containing protein [Apiosordaria backusii]|uniref:Endo-chitosanase n=1 Tax=Apiosordaria backusii TaxID=314023 RepID=A0AA40BDS4_9PEZI|nr:fungal chitosanase of glycosyl hydrolase group 75-domain-containing protein [Apiosordaria backusii]